MITIWHNPRCSKSRQALSLLEENGAPFIVRKYLDDAPSLDELKTAQSQLGLSAIDMMRTGEAQFKELGLRKTDADDVLLSAMADHPKLIERAIVFSNGQAVIARPPELLKTIL